MPRKTKEDKELKEKKNTSKTKSSTTKKVASTKKTNKATATSKEVASTKAATKTEKSTTSKKVATKPKEPETSKKTASKSKSTSTKPKTTSKSKSTTTKSKSTSTTKKATTKKTTKTTKTKKSTSTTKKSKKVESATVEYYDLPQRYNQTVVKVLAQTPKTLFIYWEISDDDIAKYKNQYGENFFETTKPVLIIHNDTLNYSFEVEINDFANSWYLHVNDSKSDYRIELGRRPIYNNENIKENYIYISSSNKIESPNDHILFNNSQKMVYYRNVKTNQEIQKPVSSLFFMKNMGKIYDIYDLYQELYKNEDNLENLSNPSSNTSSQFK